MRAVLGQLISPVRLVAGLLYGSGLRLMEALSLRVKDLDFRRGEITVLANPDGTRRVDFFQRRRDGTFGFEESRWDAEQGSWIPFG